MKKILPFLLLLALFSGCSPEWKLGREFVKKQEAVNVVLLPTDEVFREISNEKRLLDSIPDSVILDTYYNSLIDELVSLNCNVYLDQMGETLFDTTPGLILHVAQIVLEESVKEYELREDFSDGTYYQTENRNTVDFDYWFEVSLINDSDSSSVLYDTQSITDVSMSYFYQRFFTGQILFKEQIIPLTVDDIVRELSLLGKRHAQMVYDLMLNKYIEKHYPPGKEVKFLLHYNADKKYVEPVYQEDELFQVLDE